MNTTEIRTRIAAIEKTLVDAGLYQPHLHYEVKTSGDKIVVFHGHLSKVEFFDTLEDAETWANALPTAEEAAKQKFATDLAELIERGRSIEGVDVAPLCGVHKHVYENLLVSQ